MTLDRNSGLGLAEAVAASCAIPGVWPAVTWGDRRLMDGGIRTGRTPTWPSATTASSSSSSSPSAERTRHRTSPHCRATR
ncbi:patatin-like phospholipase family protein [Streptomyces antimycoticus]|uniref:patatin-like phospholipase family protein n=1 Tax=Streptomyces antimycoticus TaxID=68175 RepID=UPI0036B9BDCA